MKMSVKLEFEDRAQIALGYIDSGACAEHACRTASNEAITSIALLAYLRTHYSTRLAAGQI